MTYDPCGLLNFLPEEIALAERDAREEQEGGWLDYPPGSIGWLRARGICCECGFQPASRLMVDPTCSPELPYCEPCIAAINRIRFENDESELEEACPDCGGSGRYDDVRECPSCGGEGTAE